MPSAAQIHAKLDEIVKGLAHLPASDLAKLRHLVDDARALLARDAEPVVEAVADHAADQAAPTQPVAAPTQPVAAPPAP